MRATILVCALVAVITPCARSELVNVIHQYNPYYDDPNNPGYPFYEIVGAPDNRVRIYRGVENQMFEFEAGLYDPNEPGSYVEEGDISAIVADPNAGPVTLTVVGHNDYKSYGARNIGQIDFSAAGVTGTIAALSISADLNAVGPTTTANAGNLAIDGSVLDLIDIRTGAGGEVRIGTLAAVLRCRGLAKLTVDDTTPQAAIECWPSPGPAMGEVRVGGQLDHLYFFDDVVAPVTVWGDIGGLFASTIAPPPGTRFSVGAVGIGDVGDIVGEMKTSHLTGGFTVHGDVSGALLVSGEVRSTLQIDGALTGTLEADTGLGSASHITLIQASSGTVHIGRMATCTFRTVYGDFSGHLQVDQIVSSLARFLIGFRANGVPTYANLTGSIRVAANDTDTIYVSVSGALDDPYDPNVPGSQPLSGGHVILPSYCAGEIIIQRGHGRRYRVCGRQLRRRPPVRFVVRGCRNYAGRQCVHGQHTGIAFMGNCALSGRYEQRLCS